MFGSTGNDANQLQNEYNFGELESAANGRRRDTAPVPARQNSDDFVVPEDVHVADVQNTEQFSPQEGGTFGSYGNPPMSPMAFGNPEGGGGAVASGTTNPPPTFAPQNGAKKEGKQTHVVKEVLGMNKTSTKGKSDEEKAQIKLEERWKNAVAEEERLNAMDHQVRQGEALTQAQGKEPNLPRKFFCIHPLVYHNIESEVPAARQRFVTIAFWNWVAVSILIFMNCGIAIGVGFAHYKDEAHKRKYPFNKALNTVLAAVYLIGVPLSFISWYWRIYRACSTRRPTQHLVAMMGLIIGLAWAVFCFIGPRAYGACGIQMTIHIGKSRKTGAVVPVAVMIFLWLGEAAMMCFLIVKEWIFYREDLLARRAALNALKTNAPPPA